MIFVLLVVLGLVFGSFVNALAWRLHEQAALREQLLEARPGKQSAKKVKRLKAELQARSMVKGRSMCSRCHHELAARDLVPVLSWLWLRGKCRYCGVTIEDNPLVEVCTGLLFAASYLWWPLSLHGVGLFQFVAWLGFLVVFVALAVYDTRWFLLPNVIVFPLIAAAVVEVTIVAITSNDWHFALNAAAGGLIIYGIFYLLFIISDGAWIGGGDVKLVAALGLMAGTPLKALLVLFFASILGTVVSIPLLLRGKAGMRAHVPFGPFLLSASVVVVLFGGAIVNWYTGLLGY